MDRLPCVLLSATTDLRRLFGAALGEIADRVEILDHPAPEPERVRLALAWRPPADALPRYPNLAALCSIAAGVDNLLACPGRPPDLPVVRVVDPDQARAMSGFVLWHVIGHQRRFQTYAENQRDRVWRRLYPRDASAVPVGLLGYGQIGRRVAADLAALGFPVRAWGRTPQTAGPGVIHHHGPEGLAAMLPESEVLVNLLPLTPETGGLLDAALLARLRPGGYLIQVGRGEHLVEADLLASLASGHLAGAALDVFATEPLPASHPFWDHPAIRVTPHEACEASPQAVARTLLAAAEAVREGRIPPGAVDAARGY
ncbi:hydroxyacid dehydrogenase [Methylobacterium variabile]|jgi:glyoxylate/hydroxypyruvate reductase A|uniref:Hydroxyacid dehydrogenase n=1 Tax=Methylobacterium variabile TaxID=298794 RepID=A0A0J6T686_9HYPH|nr:glyoxylate/hydroxypyruvate reductase A [Methylobacterium variabile]KMO41043.1 hydroxyacid dehydrogenase [Methylobacterium variabile]